MASQLRQIEDIRASLSSERKEALQLFDRVDSSVKKQYQLLLDHVNKLRDDVRELQTSVPSEANIELHISRPLLPLAAHVTALEKYVQQGSLASTTAASSSSQPALAPSNDQLTIIKEMVDALAKTILVNSDKIESMGDELAAFSVAVAELSSRSPGRADAKKGKEKKKADSQRITRKRSAPTEGISAPSPSLNIFGVPKRPRTHSAAPTVAPLLLMCPI